MLVVHAQRHAEVRVRPQIVLDHTGWALRRQYQVQSERTTTLCHIHHAVDELRYLTDQGRELVDDDDQARRALRVAAFLELDEILDALGVE